MNCEILGISFDAPEANKAFREKHDFPFRLLSDYDEQVGVKYETRDPGTDKVSFAKRLSYLIDPDGIIRKSYEKGLVMIAPIGFHGNVIRISPPLNIPEELAMKGVQIIDESIAELSETTACG